MNIDQYNFKGKKVLVRVDFNVPLDENYNITDNKRIVAAVPTLLRILKAGGSLILMSHLGRPKGKVNDKYSLSHIVSGIKEVLNSPVKFAGDCIGVEASKMASELLPGEVLLLENLRFHAEEESGDKVFASKLAALGDVFVNDAFGTAHRAHASTTIIAEFFPHDKMFGYLMAEELRNADKILRIGEKPLTAIMGGAKVSDKILLIESLLDKVDNLIVGGGMAYTFIKAQGGEIGNSLLEEDRMELCLTLLEKAKNKGVNFLLPIDAKIADKFDNDARQDYAPIDEIPMGWMGLDIGPRSMELFSEVILKSKTVLWNGPMGVFEMKSFEAGTLAVSEALVEATKGGSFTLVGGGDSAAAIAKFNMADKVSYVSTGGGALLEYMEGKVLPGVKAILEEA